MDRNDKIGHISALTKRILPVDGEAYLFGSQARGSANGESDRDVLILLDKDHITNEDFTLYGFPFAEPGGDIDAMTSPIPYTKKKTGKEAVSPHPTIT